MRKRTTYTALAGAVLPALLAVAVLSAPALASDGHAALRWGDFGWRVLNLVIFAAILWHFLGKLAVNFFKGRKQKISDGLDSLNERKEKAQKELAEIEQRIANLESERAAILEESRQQAEVLKQEIIANAEAQAKQIVEASKVAAENEGLSMLQNIRATVADEIINATRDRLLEALNAKKHAALIDKALNKVELQ